MSSSLPIATNLPLAVLLAEDSESDAALVLRQLKLAGFEVDHLRVESAAAMHAALQSRDWDLVISDFNMPGFSAASALQIVQESGKDLPFIIVSAHIGEEVAVELMRAGAHDYVMKGNLARLAPAVKRELREAADRARHRLATAALRSSDERWKFALEGAGDGVWDWNLQTNQVSFSARWKGMLGYAEHEIGDDFLEWKTRVHPDDLPRALRDMQEHIAGKTATYANEHRMLCKDGSWKWILARGMMIGHAADGQPERMIGTHCDISERKQNEVALRELNEQLESRVEARTAELRLAMEQIVESQKLASLGRLVVGVSHEMNTPIGNIILMASTLSDWVPEFSEMAQSGKLSRSYLQETLEGFRQACKIIFNNARRASELVESFKRLSIDQTSQSRRIFDLKLTVQDILMPLRVLDPVARIHIELDIPEGIMMDSFPGHLEQIINNLVTNSVRHGFEGLDSGNIVISARRQEDQIELVYTDNGLGIPKELQSKVFEPFYTTKLGQGGSGLGLAIVHNLVQGIFKGRLRLSSEEGQGIKLVFTFPAVTPE